VVERTGYSYGWHDHAYHKTLVCLDGSIVFHTDTGDVGLTPGDVLQLEPGTRHAATVGPSGVRCAEAAT
jgi:quercetin dioxygenase-like cupin family protein